ncbi:MAG TPA: S41 family peptidase, partial [Candidatus Hydrogenedentes bacterium]|nr:S41 family peptidase [Candidatus Hydrogenedentota bacterium]
IAGHSGAGRAMAIILGEKTFGKGSVQTIITLERPANTAMRLTTALYYTPANVTIDEQGILPDIELAMTPEQEEALAKQMFASFENEPENQYRQNHGRMTDYPATEETVDDTQLLKAWEILREAPVWVDLLKQYHRDVRETQMSAEEAARRNGQHAEGEADPGQAPAPENAPAETPDSQPEPSEEPVQMP